MTEAMTLVKECNQNLNQSKDHEGEIWGSPDPQPHSLPSLWLLADKNRTSQLPHAQSRAEKDEECSGETGRVHPA